MKYYAKMFNIVYLIKYNIVRILNHTKFYVL